MQIGNGQFFLGDCLDVMRGLPDGSVDMILCDLPYGTTACKWDTILPFENLWAEYWRVCKPNAAIVLTASMPFTAALVMSQIENYRYNWFWKKRPVNFLNAKKQPLRNIEDILIFGKGQINYNPQGLVARLKVNKRSNQTETNRAHGQENVSEFTNYPNQVLEIINGERGLHPTQKPVPLFEYLIKTYTDSGMTVLDNCAGSGTTAVAAERTGRKWICIEKQPEYYYPAVARVISEVSGQ